MRRATSPVNGKPYSHAAVCRACRLVRSGVYRHRTAASSVPPRQRGPAGATVRAELLAAIQSVFAAGRFHGEGNRKTWARLRHGKLAP